MKRLLRFCLVAVVVGVQGCSGAGPGDVADASADATFADATTDGGVSDGGAVDGGLDADGSGAVTDAQVIDADSADTLDALEATDAAVEATDAAVDAADTPTAVDAVDATVDATDTLDGVDATDAISQGDAEDAAATSDAMDTTDAAADPPFGLSVSVSGGTDYDSGELHGMSAVSGQVSVFWRGAKTDGSVDLVVSISDPSTASFAPPIVLKEGLPAQSITVGGDIVQAGSTYFFVWRDMNGASEQVYFRKTAQADLSGSDVLMAEASTDVWRPYLARGEQGSLCVLWQHAQDVRMRCSADDGESWASPVQVDPVGTTATVSSAAFNGANDLVVALQAGGLNANQIYVRRSSDLGQSWEDATTVDGTALTAGAVTEVLGQSNYLKPTLVLTLSGVLKLAWHRPLQGTDAEAHIITSSDGLAWTSPAVLPSVKSNVVLVSGRGEALHASGTDAKLGYGDTVYMSSSDVGASWGPAAPIPVTPDATLLDHRMRANLVKGWLYIAWWETLPNNLVKQQLQLVTIDNP